MYINVHWICLNTKHFKILEKLTTLSVLLLPCVNPFTWWAHSFLEVLWPLIGASFFIVTFISNNAFYIQQLQK